MGKPYIRIRHIVVEIVSFVFLLASVIFAVIKAASIEGEIPTHYNLQGEIDGYGSPYTMLVLPIIMLLTFILISLVVHLVPMRYWNMPVKVKPERALVVYGDMVMMLLIMELLSGIYTLFETILFVDAEHSSRAITFVYIALLFGDIVVQIIRVINHNR